MTAAWFTSTIASIRPRLARLSGLRPWSAQPQAVARTASTSRSAGFCPTSEPALAATVVLDVAERAAALAADAEGELLHVLVLAQGRGVAVEHDAAILEDVAVMGVAQRHVGVLLGQQDRHLLLLVEVLHNAEDLLDQLRRQAHRRLVEQDGAGAAHQGTADRRHLLLAAGGVAGLAGAPFLEPREVVIDLLEVVSDLALAAMDEGAGQQVLLDREMAEAVAALHHLDDAAAHQVVGRQAVDPLAAVMDAALGDLAALAQQQV